jgi:hypothetical protein
VSRAFTRLCLLLLALLSLPQPGPASGGPPEPETPSARVVRRVPLAPPEGNGIRPFAAVLDEGRDRLYVLCGLTHNLLAVDLRRRCVLGQVSLPWSHQFGYNLEERVLFDPRRDRIFITGADGSGSRTCRVVAVSASRLETVGTWEVMASRLDHAALNSARGELYVTVWRYRQREPWSIVVLDVRTVRPRRTLPLPGDIGALEVHPESGALVTIEPAPDEQAVGPRLESEADFIVVRSPDTGKETARSRRAYPFPGLLLDPRRAWALVSYVDQKEGARTAAALRLPDLKPVRASRKTGEAGQTYAERAYGQAVVDTPRDRLVAYTGWGSFQVLPLDSRGRAVPRTVRGIHGLGSSVASGPGVLAGVRPRTGEVLLLFGNGLRAFAGRTFRESWRLKLGAAVDQLFLDRETHRVLAALETDAPRLVWIEGSRIRRVRELDEDLLLNSTLIAADFRRQWLYYLSPTSNAFYVSGAPFRRSRRPAGPLPEGPNDGFYQVAFRRKPDRAYYALVGDFVKPPQETALSIWEGGRQIREASVPGSPRRLLPVTAPEELYAVYASELRSLTGRAVPLPLSRSPLRDENTPGAFSRLAWSTPVDVDEDGTAAYYADPWERVLYKIRLPGGEIAGRRRLSFPATAVLVDGAAGAVYLLDEEAGCLVNVQTF